MIRKFSLYLCLLVTIVVHVGLLLPSNKIQKLKEMATAKRSTKKQVKKWPDPPCSWTLIGIQKDTGSAIHVSCDSREDCERLCIAKNVNMDRPVYAKGPDGTMHTINQP